MKWKFGRISQLVGEPKKKHTKLTTASSLKPSTRLTSPAHLPCLTQTQLSSRPTAKQLWNIDKMHRKALKCMHAAPTVDLAWLNSAWTIKNHRQLRNTTMSRISTGNIGDGSDEVDNWSLQQVGTWKTTEVFFSWEWKSHLNFSRRFWMSVQFNETMRIMHKQINSRILHCAFIDNNKDSSASICFCFH